MSEGTKKEGVMRHEEDRAYQVTEVPFDHELQRLSRTCSIPSDHGIPCHYLTNMSGVWIQTLSGDLKRGSGPEEAERGILITL